MVLLIYEGNLIFVWEYVVGFECYEFIFLKGIIDVGEELIESVNCEL